MENIYTAQCYREIIGYHVEKLSKNEKGQLAKLSKFINIHPSYLSQVMKGDKDLSLEQALEAAKFFGLLSNEQNFFLKLIQYQRAGTNNLKVLFKKELDQIITNSNDVESRVNHDKKLKVSDQAIFYSSWMYPAVKNICTQKNMTREKISKALGLPLNKTLGILEFLEDVKLIKREDNTYKSGSVSTHLPHTSEFVASHHRNWRLKAIEKHPVLETDDLSFTASMTLSQESFLKIRAEILKFIESVSLEVKTSKEEKVSYLNIDFHSLY